MTQRLRPFLALLLAVAALAGPALAAGPEHSDPRVRLALLSGWGEADGRRVAGFRVQLAPGWKTYWRTPGEAGIPPHFDWSRSENVAGVEVRWPRPVAFDTYGMLTLGYEREVTFPLELTPEDPERAMRLALDVLFGLCSDICIPAQASLELTIPPGAPLDGARAISAALSAEPTPAAAAGVLIEACDVEGTGEARRLVATLRVPAGAATPFAVVEAPAPVRAGAVAVRREGDRLHLSAPLAPADAWVGRGGFRITLLSPEAAVEATGCP
ncbi:MAG TPA: protein-disulfide reductase DsbD domain-containing protein [Paracoccaceae bacterium]|nr:protein-disulfide reductase DsbD domain-containing protein [Paracoccaceae bacterium]